jgi:hypothetical protein
MLEKPNAMKTCISILSVGILALQPIASAEEPKAAAPSAYQQGMSAVAAGDPVTAEASFTRALQQDPNNANARYQLLETRKNAASIAAKGRAAKFGAVVVPKVQFDSATLEDSLAALGTLVTKASKDQVTPNFILEDPNKTLSSKTITITLNNIPAKAALEYILTQAGAKARFDEHAIVVSTR